MNGHSDPETQGSRISVQTMSHPCWHHRLCSELLALQTGLSSSGLGPSGSCPVLSKLSCPGQDRAGQGQPGQSHRWVQVSGSTRVGAPLEDDDSGPAVLELLQLNRPEMALLPWLLTTAALPIIRPSARCVVYISASAQAPGPAPHKRSKNQCFPESSEKRLVSQRHLPWGCFRMPLGRCFWVPSGWSHVFNFQSPEIFRTEGPL